MSNSRSPINVASVVLVGIKVMSKFAALLGWVIVIAAVYERVSNYGARWEFDEYWLPTTALAPDGMHYRDGSDLKPYELNPVCSSIERGGFVGAVICGCGLAVYLLRAHAILKRIGREQCANPEVRSRKPKPEQALPFDRNQLVRDVVAICGSSPVHLRDGYSCAEIHEPFARPVRLHVMWVADELSISVEAGLRYQRHAFPGRIGALLLEANDSLPFGSYCLRQIDRALQVVLCVRVVNYRMPLEQLRDGATMMVRESQKMLRVLENEGLIVVPV